MTDKNKTTLFSIQFLRAIAACSVAFMHAQRIAIDNIERYGFMPSKLNGFFRFSEIGGTGVDVFFAISGFVMVFVTWNKFGQFKASLDFMIKRLLRILPIYWFYTSMLVALLLLLPQLFYSSHFDFKKTVLSYLLIPSTRSIGDSHVLSVAWSLSYEMYFYFLVFLCLPFKRQFLLPIVAVIFGTGVTLGGMYDINSPVLHLMTDPLLIEFLFGMIIGTLFCRGFRVPGSLCILITIVVLIYFAIWTLGWIPGSRLVSLGMPSAILVFALVFFERASGFSVPLWILALGDSSYTLYLSHPILYKGIGKMLAFTRIQNHLSSDVYIVVMFTTMVIAAHFLYLFVERPLNQIISKKQAARDLLTTRLVG